MTGQKVKHLIFHLCGVTVILHYLSEQKYYVHACWKRENQGKSGQIKEILWLIQGKFWSRVGKYAVGVSVVLANAEKT